MSLSQPSLLSAVGKVGCNEGEANLFMFFPKIVLILGHKLKRVRCSLQA